jgi:3-(3-hydroxy-phenyl)propionate hydroxylase
VHVAGAPQPRATSGDHVEGRAPKRNDARPGTVVLLRPDQHVCARWRRFDAARVAGAIARATCNEEPAWAR